MKTCGCPTLYTNEYISDIRWLWCRYNITKIIDVVLSEEMYKQWDYLYLRSLREGVSSSVSYICVHICVCRCLER